jgi:uracil-DNA glycosylase
MSEMDIVRRLRERILTKVPTEARHQVEIEIKRVEDEVSLRHDVLTCTVCPLAETCTNKVPGIGPIDASIMLVGESPGENEDREGVPFVGRGGDMLNKAIEAVGWNRDDLYITNVVKCHPPGNRNPTQPEVAACFQHLKKEIQVIRPKVIVALGALAANTLIHPDFKITQENGHWFELSEGTRGIAVYHPSYLLRLGEGTARQNHAKWEVFNALQKVKHYQDAGFADEHG